MPNGLYSDGDGGREGGMGWDEWGRDRWMDGFVGEEKVGVATAGWIDGFVGGSFHGSMEVCIKMPQRHAVVGHALTIAPLKK